MEELKYLKDIMDLEKVIIGLEDDLIEEYKRIQFLNTQKDKKTEQNDLNSKELQSHQDEVSALEKELFDIEKKLSSAQENYNFVKTHEDELKIKLSIESLSSKNDSIQDKILAKMDSSETIESTIEENKTFIKGIQETILEVRSEVEDKEKNHREHISKLTDQIERLLTEIPESAKKLYLRSKEKNKKDPATYLIGTHCSTCKFTMSAGEAKVLQEAKDFQLCRGCGRLLLPAKIKGL